MSLATSKISVGDILLASLYTEAKAKYIVISKCDIGQTNRPLSSETMREKVKTEYSLYVLWRREGEGVAGFLRGYCNQGSTVTMSHRAMKAHYWTFDLDNQEEGKEVVESGLSWEDRAL